MPTKPSWCFPPLESCSSAAKQNIQKTLQSPGQNIYLQKVLHSFWVIAVTFTADSFHFLYLTSLASCLDVLEVNIWILTKVYNGTQEIEQSWKESHVLNTVRSEVSEGCMGFSLWLSSALLRVAFSQLQWVSEGIFPLLSGFIFLSDLYSRELRNYLDRNYPRTHCDELTFINVA